MLSAMVQLDPARTIQLLDDADDIPALRLTPGPQAIGLLTAQTFTGRAVALGPLGGPRPPGPSNSRFEREVLTAAAQ